MSFFNQQKKQINLKSTKNKVGPGSYIISSTTQNNKSYAPFGSLNKKQRIVKSQINEKIGPGSYNIHKQIIKPAISQYENEKCIIIKVNDEGGSQFRSKVQRFKTSPNQIQGNVPGPGSYKCNNNTFEEKKADNYRKRTKSVPNAIQQMKNKYNKQYKQKLQPTLKSDPVFIPKKEENEQKVKSKGVRWELNKKDRFQNLYKGVEPINEEEESSRILQNIKRQKIKQKEVRQSSAFASKSVKSCFQSLIYQTSNPFKAQLRKMLGFQDQNPGPGSYHLSQQFIKKRQSPDKFQFFGSTVERFVSEKSATDELGPGAYEDKKENIKRKVQRPLKSKQNMKTNQPEDSSHLGPGYYHYDSVKLKKSKSYNYHHVNGGGSFGSNIPRFQQKKQRKQVPQFTSFMAQQNQEKRERQQEEFHYRNNLLKNKKQSAFLSETKRNCFENKQKSPFGLYEVGVNDISNRVKKDKEHSQQFSECNLFRPAFHSSQERFKQKKEVQSTHKDCFCLVKQVQKKTIEHTSSVFQSNVRRSIIFNEKSKAPPVGQYSQQSSFIRESFNSKFIKSNQNKTKKLKMWQPKS